MRTLLELFEEGGGKLPFFAMHGGTVYRIEQARPCGAADNEFLCYFPNDTHGDWRKDSPTWQPYVLTAPKCVVTMPSDFATESQEVQLMKKIIDLLERIQDDVDSIKGSVG